MRILIISSYRCGGYSFSNWLGKELDYEMVHEPYNFCYEMQKLRSLSIIPKDPEYIFTTNDIIVKFPYQDLEKINRDDMKNLPEDLINKFDKTIGLTRENLLESAQSMVWARKNNKWHDTYSMTPEWLENNKEEILTTRNDLLDTNEKIKKLSILQVAYENIFINKSDISKIQDYLSIKKLRFLNLLDSHFRYRKNNEYI